MSDHPITNKDIVGIIGLGYVGLPLAEAFSRSCRVIGYDIDDAKPTPVTRDKKPDLPLVINAARTISQNMKKGSVVILESTVYPGVTEDIVKPILEESGYKCGVDFKIAYSPERMNPGDEEHALDKITKVVSGMGMDEATTEMVSQLYSKVAPSIFKARDIETAEAAKVIENIQRDLNIALMNELALIFQRTGVRSRNNRL
jgi:UDP-N-acetyl-D-galactosamine dehydrogenase